MRGLLIGLFLIISTAAHSTHLSSANISYRSTATPNTYVVTLTISRDCSGINVPSWYDLDVSNDCGYVNPDLSVDLISSTESSQICLNEIDNSTCNGGTLPGYEIYVFEGIITLPGACDSWTLGFQSCQRNNSIVNLDIFTCMYVETKIFSSTQPYNNSVIINTLPTPYVCNGSLVSYDLGTSDLESDSLSFKLISAQNEQGDTIVYNNGFSGNQPIPGITLDNQTGQIEFTPTNDGSYVVVVLIEEYNQCSQLVGSLIHDMQFVVESCVNTPPQAPTTVTNFDSFGTNAVLTGNKIDLCVGDQFCFDATFTDIDPGDSLILSSNVSDILPGATMVQTGFNPATATICWSYAPGYVGSTISVYANDQNCPINGFAKVVLVNLNLDPTGFAGTDSTVFFCKHKTKDLSNYLGYHSFGGHWLDPNNNLVSPAVHTDTLINGNYKYVTNSTNNQNGCTLSSSCQTSDTAYISVTLSDLSIQATTIVHSSGNFDGSISFVNSGGTPPYTNTGRILNPNQFFPNIPNPWLNRSATTHMIYVVDSLVCNDFDTVSIGFLDNAVQEIANEVVVFPNIITDQYLNIKNTSTHKIAKLNIWDTNGRLIISKNLNNEFEKIELEISNGLYICTISDPSKNEIIYSSKIVVSTP